MTSSTSFKGLLAGFAAVAIAGAALAQGNPPNPAVKDAATGAGQQSTKTTPMGTTGTPTGASTAAGTTMGAGNTTAGATGSTSMGSSSTSGSSSTASTDTSSSTTMAANDTGTTKRKSRADRN